MIAPSKGIPEAIYKEFPHDSYMLKETLSLNAV